MKTIPSCVSSHEISDMSYHGEYYPEAVRRVKENVAVSWGDIFGPCRPEKRRFYLSVTSLSSLNNILGTSIRGGTGLGELEGSSIEGPYLLARATSHCRTASKFVSSFALIP